MNTGSMNTYIIFESIINLTPGPLESNIVPESTMIICTCTCMYMYPI